MIDLIILTGVSGAGKSTAVRAFEEMDYYIVENVPLAVVPKLYKAFESDMVRYRRTVVVMAIDEALKAAQKARENANFHVTFLALDATEAELLTRFRLTRHIHPAQAHGLSLSDSIARDRKIMDEIKSYVDMYVDTSGKTATEFRKYIFTNIQGMESGNLTVSFVSFGFKHGIPSDVEMIFDTRIIPNPYWIPELKDMTGLDEAVKKFVLEDKEAKELLKRIECYLDYYIAKVKAEERNFFVIGIGCSGGQHRSVAIAEYLSDKYKKSYRTLCLHRDIGKFKK
ncbi:MAG: RNase adapter RapZ [Bacteroidia bacterium]|nr:RNase adapter RapZ [Bacteroidia bacterium]